MESLTSMRSPWLEMQDALRSLRRTTYALSGFLVVVLSVLGFRAATLAAFEVSLVFVVGLGMFLAVVLVDLRQFCEGATERIRQLGDRE